MTSILVKALEEIRDTCTDNETSLDLVRKIEKITDNALSLYSQSKEEEVRPVVKWFSEQMELKLKANDHKTGWINDDWDELHERLLEEAKELFEVCGKFRRDKNEIIGEAADVANFAMMIADRLANRIGNKKFQSKENEGKQAGVWKDANDFPKRGDLYFTKIRMIDGPEEWFPTTTNYYKEWEISEDYEVVEWLDETIQSGERGEVERLKGE